MRTDGDAPSSSPEVLFGINNKHYTKCWVSVNNNPNKYLYIKFMYSMITEGIGIANYPIDWYSNYTLSYSNDLIQWDSSTIIDTTSFDTSKNNLRLYFPLTHKSKPCKFINITPSAESFSEKINLAFYGIEFFGTLLNPFQICTKNSKYFSKIFFYFIFYIIIYSLN